MTFLQLHHWHRKYHDRSGHCGRTVPWDRLPWLKKEIDESDILSVKDHGECLLPTRRANSKLFFDNKIIHVRLDLSLSQMLGQNSLNLNKLK